MRHFIKRLFDIVAASIGLVVLSPILMTVAILVAIFLGRPIFFRQVRPGLKAEPFTLIKFRSMRDDKDKDGKLLPDNIRLTAFGRFLRSSSLDELPELINVLNGEMSLVGPRPLLMRYLPLYSPEQFRRHELRPGITGHAQVNGRNALSWEQKFSLDVWYVDNQSLWLDLSIIAKTIIAVFRRSGINSSPNETMPAFTGTPDANTGMHGKKGESNDDANHDLAAK